VRKEEHAVYASVAARAVTLVRDGRLDPDGALLATVEVGERLAAGGYRPFARERFEVIAGKKAA
jgi:hypothetical protein